MRFLDSSTATFGWLFYWGLQMLQPAALPKGGFYTYIHRRGDNGQVFYVGKGKGARANSAKDRNPHWQNIVRKHGGHVEIVAPWSLESDAFEHETFLIACFRDMGHPICNMTDGGDGISGYRHTAATRANLSAMQIGKVISAEHRAKISIAGKGRLHSDEAKAKISMAKKGIPQTEEQRRKNSEGHKGQVLSAERKAKLIAANTGRKISEETRAKMKASATGVIQSEKTRAKIGAANRGRVRTDEVRARISASLSGRPRSAETIAKISASHRARRLAAESKE